mgnify:CR=1 FL=1
MTTVILVSVLLYALFALVIPRFAVWLFLASSVIQLGWLDRYIAGAEGYRRISLLLAIILAGRVIFELVTEKKRILKSQHFLKALVPLGLIFIVITILSNFYNNESLALGLFSLRYYLVGYIACISMYFYNYRYLTVSNVKKALIFLGLLQLPISTLKYVYAGGGELLSLDSVTGTFSVYGELVACQALCIGIVIYDRLQYSKSYFGINSYVLALMLMIPLVLSKSRTASALIPIMPLFALILYSIHSRNAITTLAKAMIIIVLVIGMWVIFYQYFWSPTYDVEEQLRFEYAYNYVMKEPEVSASRTIEGPGLGRMMAIVKAFDTIGHDAFALFFGYGSGSTQESLLLNRYGRYYQVYGEFAGIGRNQFSRMLFEYGIIGLISAVWFLIYIRRAIIRYIVHRSGYELYDMYTIFLFVLIIISWYSLTLSSNFFSVLTGCMIATFQVEHDRSRQQIAIDG